MSEERMDAVYRLLDEELVDVNGQRCGRADDLRFSGDIGEPARLEGVLSGYGIWSSRFPRALRALGARLFGAEVAGRNATRVPWEAVESFDHGIALKEPASELGLSAGEDRARELIEKVPGS